MSRALVSILFTLSTASLISAQDDAKCPAGNVCIDARGTAVQTRKTVKTSANVTIKVINKNPFLFKYRTTISETVVAETAPIAFVGQLNPLLTAAAAAAAGPPPAGGSSELPSSGDWACDATPPVPADRKKGLENAFAEMTRLHKGADGDLKKALREFKTAQEVFEAARRRLHDPTAKAEQLEEGIAALKQSPGAFPTVQALDELDGHIRDVAAMGKVVSAAIDAFQKTFPSCQDLSSGSDLLIAYHVAADSLSGWSDGAKGVTTKIRQAIDAVKTATDAADLAVAERQFEESHVFGNYDAPTTVVVTVERWPVSDSDDKNKFVVAKTTFLFGGGARFLLSGGLGMSTLFGGVRRQDFQPVQGFEKKLDGTTGTTLVRVIGLKHDQQFLITPALLLNTRIWSAGDTPCAIHSVWGAVGVTAKKDGDVDVDYLAGLSFGMVNDKIVLTAAWYWAQVASLGGNLYVSAAIPDSMTTIPVQKRTASGVTVLLGFKIK